MTHQSKTILFFGNERLVSGLTHSTTPTLRGLINAGFNVAAVISHHTASQSRNQRELEVGEVAAQHNIPLLLPNKPADITEQIASYHADAAVLVAYGRIIPQHIIDLFPHGIINIHPSLLPKYRGPTPIESAILAGDHETGVSIMQLTAGMDSGPIYQQALLPLSGKEDKFEVCEKLSQRGAELLLETLPHILDGTLSSVPQNESAATYCKLLNKQDGILNLRTSTAAQAERMVRAHLNFPKSRITVFGHPIIITKAHVTNTQKTPLDLLCQDGAFLSIDELIAPSGRRMEKTAFLRGYAITG